MIEFLKIQYRLGRVTETQLDKLIIDKKITTNDKQYVMS